MAEELRFFLRTALYAGPISAVYWFVSYEVAGTALLAFVAAASVAVVAVLVRGAHAWRRRTIVDTVGFGEATDSDSALELEHRPIAPASVWPAVGGLAALLIGLGLVYGAWFWLPGIAVAASAAHGWASELK